MFMHHKFFHMMYFSWYNLSKLLDTNILLGYNIRVNHNPLGLSLLIVKL